MWNGDGRISILDVTCIQAYLAQYSIGTEKQGKPINDEKAVKRQLFYFCINLPARTAARRTGMVTEIVNGE